MTVLISRRQTLVALCSLALARGVRAADDELVQLFSDLGARRERQARFTERKFSALLKAPAESSGTLIFRAPNVLEKRTAEPKRESVRIEGNIVTYEGAPVRGDASKRTFALSDAPLLAALVESLRATLAGDLPALRRHYDVTRSAPQGRAGWELTLVPRERALLDAVARIVLRGSGGEVSSIEIVEVGGDLTLMQITALPAASAPAKK